MARYYAIFMMVLNVFVSMFVRTHRWRCYVWTIQWFNVRFGKRLKYGSTTLVPCVTTSGNMEFLSHLSHIEWSSLDFVPPQGVSGRHWENAVIIHGHRQCNTWQTWFKIEIFCMVSVYHENPYTNISYSNLHHIWVWLLIRCNSLHEGTVCSLISHFHTPRPNIISYLRYLISLWFLATFVWMEFGGQSH